MVWSLVLEDSVEPPRHWRLSSSALEAYSRSAGDTTGDSERTIRHFKRPKPASLAGPGSGKAPVNQQLTPAVGRRGIATRLFRHPCLDFFDLDDGLALIGSAIEAGVMRQLEFVTLRAHGHARRCDSQFLRAPLVASGPGMFMFRIRHRSSSKRSAPAGDPDRPPPDYFMFRMTLNAVGTGSAGHRQGPSFKSLPQRGHKPAHSSRQIGCMGAARMTCSRSIGAKSR